MAHGCMHDILSVDSDIPSVDFVISESASLVRKPAFFTYFCYQNGGPLYLHPSSVLPLIVKGDSLELTRLAEFEDTKTVFL